MSDTVIRVENLGKKYVLSHQDEQGNYKSFRNVLSQGAKNLFSAIAPGKAELNGHQPSKEEFWALKDVSFEIKQGDRVGIIGRNGAGKSTLLKILSRITEPTEGKIQIKGRVASLLEVGTGFHAELTGRENIFLNGAILGMSKAEIRRKFDEIVAFAEVEKFLDTPVKRYSSGMYVRLAFAVAAHLEPEILIVDEVLAVGDAQFQKKCLGKMENVGKEGRTVIFVSHSMAAVNQLCEKVIWLNQGCLVSQGQTSEIVPKYLSQYTSDFPIFIPPKQLSKRFSLIRTVLQNHHEDPSVELDARFPFTVSLDYQIIEPIRDLELSVRIKTYDGISVFTAVYSCSENGLEIILPGIYTATVKVPGLFLIPGSYTLSCAAYEFNNHSFHPYNIYDEVIRFSINETGTKIAKYKDNPRNIGVVLVEMPWIVNQH